MGPDRTRVLALDVGTSSVRALLYDGRDRPVPDVEVHIPYEPRVAADGTGEVDADQLLKLVQECVQRALQQAGPERAVAIAGVGVSTFWHGLLATDTSARALTPLYLWSDARSWRAIEKLRERFDSDSLRVRTGCPIHTSYWLAKLAWLKDERPDLWTRPVRWVSFGDLLYWRLFGRLGTSLSMASGTGLFLLDQCAWDEGLLEYLQIGRASLPPIREAEKGLQPEYASLWPELAEVPWLHALGDGALANFGSGCLTPAQRALTVGTSGALRVIHSGPARRLPPGLWCYRLDRERLVAGGALNNGGNLHAWLLETLRLDPERLEAQVAQMAPAAHGLTFLPHLAGERSLGYAPHAFGAIAGLNLATTPVELVRAGLEAVAIEFARVDGRLDQVFPGAQRLVASGGGLLHSPAWMQMMADAIGRPVATGKAKEASSHGAAMYALEWLGLADSASMAPGVGRVFQPRPEAVEAYRAATAREENLYAALITDRVLDRVYVATA